MRKLCLTLATFFFSLMLVLPVHAAQVYSDGFFQYHAYEGYNSICGYFGSETTVTVPSRIAGLPVSRIEAGAFDGCSTIEKLVLPDTIMEIEEGAFSGAKNLKTIEDASGVWDRMNAGNQGDGSTEDGAGESANDGNGAGSSNHPGDSGEGSPIGDYEYTEPENDGQAESGKQTPESGETDTGKADESQKEDGGNSASKTDSGKKNDRNETEIITDSNNKTKDESKSGVSHLILWIILAAVLVAVAAAVAVVIIRRKRNFS